MSNLLIQELKTSLEQRFSFKLNTRYNIGSFNPYIFMMGAPAGIFLFEIIKNEVVIYSKEFSCVDIQESLNTVNVHARVFMPFIPDAPVFMEKGEFTARLSAVSGYEYTFTSWIGWIQEYENRTNEIDYEVIEDIDNPLSMRIKTFKEGIYI